MLLFLITFLPAHRLCQRSSCLEKRILLLVRHAAEQFQKLALARAWEWRRKLETGEANTINDLAAAEGLPDRFVSRQIRIAYLAPMVVERLVVKQEIPAVKIADLIDIAANPWGEQECAVFGSN